jgi:hypothetical protein
MLAARPYRRLFPDKKVVVLLNAASLVPGILAFLRRASKSV